MQGIYFLAGLIAIVWLAYWVAQEGRSAPGAKRRWSPFEWREDAPPAGTDAAPDVASHGARSSPAPSWRDRRR